MKTCFNEYSEQYNTKNCEWYFVDSKDKIITTINGNKDERKQAESYVDYLNVLAYE